MIKLLLIIALVAGFSTPVSAEPKKQECTQGVYVEICRAIGFGLGEYCGRAILQATNLCEKERKDRPKTAETKCAEARQISREKCEGYTQKALSICEKVVEVIEANDCE
jgi:hypothetical protein